MADGLTLNAGTGGATLLTDDTGLTGHAQVVKLAIATNGDATLIPADATNGIDVDVTRVSGNVNVVAQSNSGVDIGDVTINNAAGAAAVPIQDGGNVITVDGTVAVTNADLTTLAGAVAATHMQCDVLTLPTVTVQDGGGAITVDGTVAVTNAGITTIAGAVAGTEMQVDVVGALPAGDNNIGNVDIVTVPADPFGANADVASATGSISAKLRYMAAGFASDGHQQCDVLSLPSLPSGTNGIGKLTANTGVDIGDVDVTSVAGMPTGANATQVQGTVAHDSAVANNPVPMAGRAANAAVTAVANADVSHIMTDLNGKQIVVPYAVPELFVSGVTAAITDTTRTSVIAAGAAGVRHYITSIIVTNSHATVGTFVKIEDGTTEKFTGYAAAAGGGFAISLPVPLVGTAATAWNASCVTTGANVVVSLVGYKAP